MSRRPRQSQERIVRLRGRRTAPYATVDKAVFNDPRLSYKAKGIFGYLIGKPVDWKVRLTDLVAHSTDGNDAVKSGLRELRRYGYASCRAHKGPTGRILEWVWTVFETPDLAGSFVSAADPSAGVDDCVGQLPLFERAEPDFHAEKPQVDFPLVDEPLVGKPPLLSNDSTEERLHQTTNAGGGARPPSRVAPPAPSHPIGLPFAAAAFAAQGKPPLRTGGGFPRELISIREMLCRHGFDPRDAEQQVLKFGERAVRDAVGSLEWLQRNGRSKHRPTGWLMAVMKAKSAVIDGVAPARTRDEDKRASLQAVVDRQTDRQTQAAEVQGEQQFNAAIDALSGEAWAAAYHEIADRVPPFCQQRIEKVGARNHPVVRTMVFRWLEAAKASALTGEDDGR